MPFSVAKKAVFYEFRDKGVTIENILQFARVRERGR
jgi:hypothetical protein